MFLRFVMLSRVRHVVFLLDKKISKKTVKKSNFDISIDPKNLKNCCFVDLWLTLGAETLFRCLCKLFSEWG